MFAPELSWRLSYDDKLIRHDQVSGSLTLVDTQAPRQLINRLIIWTSYRCGESALKMLAVRQISDRGRLAGMVQARARRHDM